MNYTLSTAVPSTTTVGASISPLNLFMSNLIREKSTSLNQDQVETIIIKSDNARIKHQKFNSRPASVSLSHSSHHSVHRWEEFEPSPNSSNLRKHHNQSSVLKSCMKKQHDNKTQKNKTTTFCSDSINHEQDDSTSTSIQPPPRSVGFNPSTVQTFAFSVPIPDSLRVPPNLPVRQLSEEPSIASNNDSFSSLGGSASDLGSQMIGPPTRRTSSIVLPPLRDDDDDDDDDDNWTYNSTNQHLFSHLSRHQVLKHKSPTSMMISNNLVLVSPVQQRRNIQSDDDDDDKGAGVRCDEDPKSPPILMDSDGHGARKISFTMAVQSTASDPAPTLPIRKPSRQEDGTPLSPVYLPAPPRLRSIRSRGASRPNSNIRNNDSGSTTTSIKPPKRGMYESGVYKPPPPPAPPLPHQPKRTSPVIVVASKHKPTSGGRQEFTIVPDPPSSSSSPSSATTTGPSHRNARGGSPMNNIYQRKTPRR